MKITDEAVKAGAEACREITFNALTMDECRDATRIALEAALPHLSQGAVRVKPLEWVRGWMNAEAQSAIGLYIITYRRDGSFDWHVGDHNGWASSWDEAKAAAQAHYERHTLSPAPAGVTDEGQLPTRAEAAAAAKLLLRCNGFDLDQWGGGDLMDDFPMDALKTLASHEPAPTEKE